MFLGLLIIYVDFSGFITIQKRREFMSACRDCPKCTRLGIVKLLMVVPNIIYALFLSWNIGLFRKNCPDCGHLLANHHKRTDGSFAD